MSYTRKRRIVKNAISRLVYRDPPPEKTTHVPWSHQWLLSSIWHHTNSSSHCRPACLCYSYARGRGRREARSAARHHHTHWACYRHVPMALHCRKSTDYCIFLPVMSENPTYYVGWIISTEDRYFFTFCKTPIGFSNINFVFFLPTVEKRK